MLGWTVAAVLAVDDDGLDERIFELDAVRKLLAHEPGDRRQEQ